MDLHKEQMKDIAALAATTGVCLQNGSITRDVAADVLVDIAKKIQTVYPISDDEMMEYIDKKLRALGVRK